MELMGIADEASPSIDGQIRATKELGWKWIEARFAEVDGFEKGSIHDIPDEAFDITAAKLEAAGVGIYAFGSTICNWAKTIDTPWDITVAEIDRAIPRMQHLGTKFVRIMSFQPADDADKTPELVFARLREVNARCLDYMAKNLQVCAASDACSLRTNPRFHAVVWILIEDMDSILKPVMGILDIRGCVQKVDH